MTKKPKSDPVISVRLSEKLLAELDRVSGADKRSRSDWVRLGVEEEITRMNDQLARTKDAMEKAVLVLSDGSYDCNLIPGRDGACAEPAPRRTAFVTRLLPGGAALSLVGGRLMSVQEVAAVLGVSTATVYKLAHEGDLPHVRIGNAIRVEPGDLRAWLEERLVSAQDPRGSRRGPAADDGVLGPPPQALARVQERVRDRGQADRLPGEAVARTTFDTNRYQRRRACESW